MADLTSHLTSDLTAGHSMEKGSLSSSIVDEEGPVSGVCICV